MKNLTFKVANMIQFQKKLYSYYKNEIKVTVVTWYFQDYFEEKVSGIYGYIRDVVEEG